MPIRFRCPHCARLLGIATRKAGTEIACPQCGVPVTVPRPPGTDSPDARGPDDIDELLGNATPAPAAPSRPAAVAPQPAPPAPRKRTGDSLFENGDVDALLGLPPVWPPVEEAGPVARKSGTKPVAGMDVNSLDDGGTWVLGPRKAALLVVGVALLLAVAFGGGFWIASLL